MKYIGVIFIVVFSLSVNADDLDNVTKEKLVKIIDTLTQAESKKTLRSEFFSLPASDQTLVQMEYSQSSSRYDSGYDPKSGQFFEGIRSSQKDVDIRFSRGVSELISYHFGVGHRSVKLIEDPTNFSSNGRFGDNSGVKSFDLGMSIHMRSSNVGYLLNGMARYNTENVVNSFNRAGYAEGELMGGIEVDHVTSKYGLALTSRMVESSPYLDSTLVGFFEFNLVEKGVLGTSVGFGRDDRYYSSRDLNVILGSVYYSHLFTNNIQLKLGFDSVSTNDNDIETQSLNQSSLTLKKYL